MNAERRRIRSAGRCRDRPHEIARLLLLNHQRYAEEVAGFCMTRKIGDIAKRRGNFDHDGLSRRERRDVGEYQLFSGTFITTAAATCLAVTHDCCGLFLNSFES